MTTTDERWLYKYVPAECLDKPDPFDLRITQPSALNDPSEGSIRLGHQDEVRVFLERAIGSDDLHALFDHLNNHVGVVSFSSVATNPQMWAQYAHLDGLVLGFLRRDVVDARKFDPPLTAVTYTEHEPILRYGRDEGVPLAVVNPGWKTTQVFKLLPGFGLTAEHGGLLLRHALAAKHVSWAHEQEHRLILSLTNGKLVGPDENGRPVRTIRIPVSEIMLGPEHTPSQRDRVEEIVGKWTHPYAMGPSEASYGRVSRSGSWRPENGAFEMPEFVK